MRAQTPTPQEWKGSSSTPAPTAADPGRLTLCLALLGSLGVCYRGYLFYSVHLRDEIGYTAVLNGTANAPDQYRIGVVRTAYWMVVHLHIRMSRAFGVLDFIGSTVAVLLLYRVFELSPVFRRSTLIIRWIGSAALAAMILFYLNWVIWYQKVETLPTAGLVALMLWLWTPGRQNRNPIIAQCTAAAGFLAVVVVQAFVRADVALFLCLGLLAISLTPSARGFAFSPRMARGVSLLGTALAAGIQLYLMKIAYPHATYGNVPAFMILHDYDAPMLWFAFFIFTAPFLWTVYQVIQRRFQDEPASVAFMIAAIGYIGLWVALGRLDEVRIFIPLGLALTPLLAEMLMLHLQTQTDQSHTSI